MKRLLLFLVFMSCWLPGLLIAQAYEDGSRSYKYEHPKKEKETERIKKQIKALISEEQHQEALSALDKAKAILPPGELSALKKEIKKKWHDQLLKEAKKNLKKKNLPVALNKCHTAYSIITSHAAQKLRRRIKKMIDSKQREKVWIIFADSGINANFKLNLLNFNWEGNSNYWATVTDSGSVKAAPPDDNKYNYGFGLMRMLSPSLGIMVSTSFIKKQLKVITNYRYDLVWYDGVSFAATGTMSENGNISLIPINLDVLTSLKMSKKLAINLYGGPTLLLTKIDLTMGIGYGGIWSVPGDNMIYGEWFPFRYSIKKSGVYPGINGGIELEYKSSSSYSAYVGLQYFALFKKSFGLTMINQPYYGQIWDSFILEHPYELENLPNYKIRVQVNNYRINVGIKLYF